MCYSVCKMRSPGYVHSTLRNTHLYVRSESQLLLKKVSVRICVLLYYIAGLSYLFSKDVLYRRRDVNRTLYKIAFVCVMNVRNIPI